SEELKPFENHHCDSLSTTTTTTVPLSPTTDEAATTNNNDPNSNPRQKTHLSQMIVRFWVSKGSRGVLGSKRNLGSGFRVKDMVYDGLVWEDDVWQGEDGEEDDSACD
ncbi:hypothetical protein M8C21_024227, partial [Ambrosia artemisiifolia]